MAETKKPKIGFGRTLSRASAPGLVSPLAIVAGVAVAVGLLMFLHRR